jgi:hypothetical protein
MSQDSSLTQSGQSVRQALTAYTRLTIEHDERIRRGLLDRTLPEVREFLATRFTDTNSYYVSQSSGLSALKAHDLIGSPAFIVIKAADEFRDKTSAPNQTVRPRTNGPRSLIPTMTERPLATLVTRNRVPNGNVG